jgi:hypothetical protein
LVQPIAVSSHFAIWHGSVGIGHVLGVPEHTPFVHTSPLVQNLPSSHEAPLLTGVFTHPFIGSHVPTLHASLRLTHWLCVVHGGPLEVLLTWDVVPTLAPVTVALLAPPLPPPPTAICAPRAQPDPMVATATAYMKKERLIAASLKGCMRIRSLFGDGKRLR